jgi:ferredoxin--NADP+ reductase
MSQGPASNAVLLARHDLSPEVARFLVRPDEGVPAFAAGQYMTLGLPLDGRLLVRPYSTASAPSETSEVEFLIRRVSSGALTPRLWELRPGDRLSFGRPKGLFRLRPDQASTHVLVSTGTGLAPFISMVSALLHNATSLESVTPRALVVHGVAHAHELAYRDKLEAWAAAPIGVRYAPAISRPQDPANAGWDGWTGRLDEALGPILDAHAIEPERSIVYLCGNPGMISAAQSLLAARGFTPDAIVSEQYWPAA